MVKAKQEKVLTVYGSHGRWYDERNTNVHRQARFIVAAPSKAAIHRAYPELKQNEWTKTANEQELAAALAKPMALFAKGIYVWDSPYVEILDYDKTVRR